MSIKKNNKYLVFGIVILFFLNYSNLVYNIQFKESNTNTNSKTLPINNLSYNETAEIIYGRSAFNMVFESSIHFDGKDDFYIYFGEEEIFSTRNNTLDDIEEITNSTYKAAFYSLMFVRELLRTGEIDNMTVSQIDQLNKIILRVINQSKKVPLMDQLILNPHPVSERIEVLILYSAYYNEKFDDKHILDDFHSHINQLSVLLENDDFFRYSSNHGLMQLRALLGYYTIKGDTSSLKNVIQRIKEVYPIFVAKDGSILESSTGYQLFIYDQFEIMNHLINFSKTDSFLNDQIRVQKNYFSSIITKDGFLQGLGDAYSKYVDTLKYPIIEENTMFNYLNGIAGLKAYSNDGDILSILFVSMDNKPNAHKLPEDLSLYIYNNEPFFVNTGIYSYELHDENRSFIRSNLSQNGVHFEKNSVVASNIEIENSVIGGLTFKGNAFSSDSIAITRNLQIDIINSKLIIQDSSERDVASRFIVHPDITLNVIDDFNIEMVGKKEKMLFTSIHPILITDTWVSDYYKHKVDAQMFVIKTKNNRVEIQNSRPFKFEIDNIFDTRGDTTERLYLVNNLKFKYPRSLTDIRKISQSHILFFIVIIFSLILMKFSSKRWVMVIYSLFFLFLVFDLIVSASLITLIMDYFFLGLNYIRNML